VKTVALQLVDVLEEFGVNVVFGIPGGAISGLYAALMERPHIRVVTAKHETAAVFLAMGYAIATGRPGVVITTAGPGITNALTGLASAFYEGVPVVHIAGEVPRSSFGRGALQESSSLTLDAVSLAARITKFSAQIARAGSAAAVMRKALATCYSGRRGPAFISLPLDIANEPAATQPIGGNVRSSFEIDTDCCRRAIAMLDSAKRPLILAGSGARDLTSRRALRRLAERLGSPVAVSTKGKGVFPEEHPLYIGIFGFGGHDSVTRYLSEGADVLLACGTGLNDFSTNAWSPLLRASRAFIQIDIDAAQLGKNYAIDLGLLGPVDGVISRMLEMPLQPTAREVHWTGPQTQKAERSPKGMLTTAEVVLTMNEVCPPDSVVTADMGEHLAIVLHYLRVQMGGDFMTFLGFGSMGSGICGAMGYQFGAPMRQIYAVCGDGGFLMYGNELATAVQHRLCTTFVIINDSRLNMVHHGMHDLYGRSPDFSTQLIDFSSLARTFGAEGHVVETRDQLQTLLRRRGEGPMVLDVRIDPDVRLHGSQRNAALRTFKEEPHVC
jgi:acetolactate synthase-1/2/3 large subunit